MLDSLVRVSRRADYDHYASILAEARTSPGARCITRGYNTPEGATFPGLLSPRGNRCWPAPRGVHRRERRMIRPARVWSQALPLQQFHVLFNPLFKVLFIFRSLYLCAIGLPDVFSLGWILPPNSDCTHKQPYSRIVTVDSRPQVNGALTLFGPGFSPVSDH